MDDWIGVDMDERTCATCCERFNPKRRDQRFCSPQCCSKAHRNNSNRVCGLSECGNPTRAKGLCAYHYKREYHPDSRARWPENAENRRRKLRVKTQQRRAKVTDPQAELIDRDDIGERDGWACGLCADPIDRTVPWPDPTSASLDHIVPLSRGGQHTKTNVQISHLGCNMRKGARVA